MLVDQSFPGKGGSPSEQLYPPSPYSARVSSPLRKPSITDRDDTLEDAFESTAPLKPSPFPAWLIIGTWILLSTTVILYNQDILKRRKFAYPITLTSCHLLFQTVATRILHATTNLLASTSPDYRPLSTNDEESSPAQQAMDRQRMKEASVEMNWDVWMRQIVPPALMFSVSLVASNWAYIYLSVAYIHVLKAFSPVAILLAAFAFRTKEFSLKLICVVLVISGGTGMASWGEASFNMTGFLIQVFAIFVEATRVTLIQILLGGKDMSPLKTLYFFAPICLAANAVLVLPVEGFEAIWALKTLGPLVLLSNASLTFLLNLSTVYLIGLSSIVLSLTKVVKDIGLVAGSALLLGDVLSPTQVVGYLIATGGLIWYKLDV